jgi:allantoicase
MKIDYSVILSSLGAQFGPLILAVLAVGAVIVGLSVALLGTERVLSLVSGQETQYAKRYERERRREKGKRDSDEAYEKYRVRRERRAANRGW